VGKKAQNIKGENKMKTTRVWSSGHSFVCTLPRSELRAAEIVAGDLLSVNAVEPGKLVIVKINWKMEVKDEENE
jgi:hypothetical protein